MALASALRPAIIAICFSGVILEVVACDGAPANATSARPKPTEVADSAEASPASAGSASSSWPDSNSYAKFPHCSDDQGAWQRMMIDAADFTALSLWALVSGHWSVWQAARVEVTQQAESAEWDANPVEHRVVASLIEATTVEAV